MRRSTGRSTWRRGFRTGTRRRRWCRRPEDAMDAHRHQYAITWGAPELRAALATKLTRDYGRPVDGNRELVVTCGATEAMMVAMMTVCDPGDRVGLFSPFYESYNADAILTGATPVHVPLRGPGWQFDPAELRAAFAERAESLCVVQPVEPMRAGVHREERADRRHWRWSSTPL